MVETRAPSHPRWYQFRLRTLLAGMAVIGVLLLAARWYVEPFRHQRNTMELIQSLGGSYETSPPQKWQAWYFGGDYQNLIHVNLADCDQTDRFVAAVAGLPRLETLVVGGESFGDEQLQQLRQLSSLHVLMLDSTSVSDDALAS